MREAAPVESLAERMRFCFEKPRFVCLSNERVGSPEIEHPDVLIAMNEPSLHKIAKQVARQDHLQQR